MSQGNIVIIDSIFEDISYQQSSALSYVFEAALFKITGSAEVNIANTVFESFTLNTTYEMTRNTIFQINSQLFEVDNSSFARIYSKILNSNDKSSVNVLEISSQRIRLSGVNFTGIGFSGTPSKKNNL